MPASLLRLLFIALAMLAAPLVSASDLTIQHVEIDPLGAPPDVPWLVHTDGLRVLDEPSSATANVLGLLNEGAAVRGDYCVVIETDEEYLRIEHEGAPAWISRTGLTRPHPRNLALIAAHGNLPYGQEIVNRWWAIPIEYEASDLVDVPEQFTRRGNHQLRAEAVSTLVPMMEAARADGVEFYVGSAYRSGLVQKRIYDRNIRRRLNQRSSAPPGHSEHQLGTTCDFSKPMGGFLRNEDEAHDWLAANAHRYGWRQTYLADNIAETGYIEEPWHWRYVGEGLGVGD